MARHHVDAPDFSKYTQSQLEQILGRIDAERFPERVQEIKARLAALATESATAAPVGTATTPAVATIAGFWRRLFAFLIDMLILGVVGLIAGTLLYDQFAALGAWGRLLGFAITLLYFGLTESWRGDGQSVGLKAMGLRVVSTSGESLGTPAAFTRAGIFCLAYFLNGAMFPVDPANFWIGASISFLIFGLIFSIGYLIIFNRRTGQSLHDLVVGAVVVRAPPGKVSLVLPTVWRGHACIIGAATLIGAVGSGWAVHTLKQNKDFAPLFPLLREVYATPGVGRANVSVNWQTMNGNTSHHLRIDVTSAPDVQADALAQRLAQLALANFSAARSQQSIVVTLTTGFDIGIASVWNSTRYDRTPAQWQSGARAD